MKGFMAMANKPKPGLPPDDEKPRKLSGRRFRLATYEPGNPYLDERVGGFTKLPNMGIFRTDNEDNGSK